MRRNVILTKYIYSRLMYIVTITLIIILISSRRSERYQEWWMNFKSRKEVKAGGNQHITEKGVHTVQGKELKGRAMNHYVCYLAKRRTPFSSRGSDPLYTSRPALRYIEKKLYQRSTLWEPLFIEMPMEVERVTAPAKKRSELYKMLTTSVLWNFYIILNYRRKYFDIWTYAHSK